MDSILTLENLINLAVLLFLQAVLGFDNLLYISIESQRAPKESQALVRRNGILIAIALRVVLLFVMISLLDSLKNPFLSLNWTGVITGEINFACVIFILGGCFLMYTALKEIHHMLSLENIEEGVQDSSPKSTGQVIALIVFMNLIFSFDSILSALAITKVFSVLAIAIIASGLGMLFLADRVSEFIKKNRKYEILGMFILLIVGIVLLGDGGHKAGLSLFGHPVEPLSKTTFYFSLVVLVAVDILQTGYQRKLERKRREAKVRT